MAKLQGTWTPETDREAEWITQVNSLTQSAFEDGISQDALVAGLSFLAASVAMHDPDADADPEPVSRPDPPERVQECPMCERTINGVQAFIGGEAVVAPCGCSVDVDAVAGWVEGAGEADG